MKLREILKRSFGVCFDFDRSKFVSCLSSGDLLLVKYFIHKLSRCEFIYPTVEVSKGHFSKSWGLRASVSFSRPPSPSPLLPSVLRSPQFLRRQKAKNASAEKPTETLATQAKEVQILLESTISLSRYVRTRIP